MWWTRARGMRLESGDEEVSRCSMECNVSFESTWESPSHFSVTGDNLGAEDVSARPKIEICGHARLRLPSATPLATRLHGAVAGAPRRHPPTIVGMNLSMHSALLNAFHRLTILLSPDYSFSNRSSLEEWIQNNNEAYG